MHDQPRGLSVKRMLDFLFNNQTMKGRNIGLIGHGHLGRALEKECQNQGMELMISEGRGRNEALVKQSDVVLLTVKPEHVQGALTEVRSALQDTLVISFVAAVPQAMMQEWADHSQIVRAMTDIGCQQMIVQANELAGTVLAPLSHHDLIQSHDEEAIDIFTAIVGCLPGVAAWHFAHNKGAKDWLEAYTQWAEDRWLISSHVTRGIVAQAAAHESAEKLLESVATKGGITEAMVQALSADAEIAFEALVGAGLDRVQSIVQTLK